MKNGGYNIPSPNINVLLPTPVLVDITAATAIPAIIVHRITGDADHPVCKDDS